MSANDLLMVAGEASGDLHGSRLLTELRQLQPGLRPFGLGGDELQAAGLESFGHSAEIAVVGITEAVRILGRARKIYDRLLEEVDRRRPKAAVLIDFPEFNLRLARALKEKGVRVVYYISPQVWAWRRGRVKTIAERVHKMIVLFPFELDFYRERDVRTACVGHPLVDEVPDLPQAWDAESGRPRSYRVALLPGSRPSEVRSLLPPLLEAAAGLARELPVAFRLILAPTLSRDQVEGLLDGTPVEAEIVTSQRFHALADSHLALCASGTATLEVGLLGTPMIVVYRVGGWTYRLGQLLVRLPDISLVNLVLGRRAVPELIQSGASPAAIRREAAAILGDLARVREMRAALAELRGKLGTGGASRRAAVEVHEVLLEGVEGAA